MKLTQKCCHSLLCAAAVALAAWGLSACADNDIRGGGNNNGNINGPLDPVEAYTRAFVKEFGEFKAQKWSEAVSGVISVRTSKPTPVNVFADVDGQRFIFASFGALNGLQPIMVHIPNGVEELIVEADGVEYKTKLGEVLDLTEGSRYAVETEYVTGDIDNFKINVHGKVRKIRFGGTKFRDNWLRYNSSDEAGFHLYNGQQNFCNAIADTIKMQNKLGLLLNTGTHCVPTKDTKSLHLEVYPLFWRENVHGESDYLLGIYYWHVDRPKQIKMIDFEELDFKDAISYKKNGTSEYVKSSTGRQVPYDVTKLVAKDSIAMEAVLLDLDCGAFADGKLSDYFFGFYIKSGLKPGYTEGKGRNYTHITYQGNMHNGQAWGQDNYWDMPFRDVIYSYTGAVVSTPKSVTNARPDRADGLVWGYNGENATQTDGAKRYMVNFMSQPLGNKTKPEDVDFSDVIIGYSYADLSTGVEHNSYGATYGAYPWYLAAEDLGSTDDWDFNDIVVNVYDLTTDFTKPYVSTRGRYPVPTIMGRRITVLPRATGATYPIYLMYDGEVAEDATDETHLSALASDVFQKGTYVVGTEMHAWLGEPDYKKMLNTGLNDGYTGGAISFCVPLMKEGTEEINPHNPPQLCSGVNQGIRGFWVLVDKEDAMRAELENTAFDVKPLDPLYYEDRVRVFRHVSQTKNVLKPFAGRLGEGAYRVDPPKESGSIAPQMLMCQYSWQWPVERANIGNVYSSFRDWVAGKRTTWHANGAAGEGTNGHDPTKVCGDVAQPWIQ